MELTKREKFMLKEALDFSIHRYLLSNTYGREDGHERAMRHMEISQIIVSFILCEKYHFKYHKSAKGIHDYLSEILTNRMDKVIGFPVFEKPYDYDEYVDLFFERIIEHIDEIEKIVLKGTME